MHPADEFEAFRQLIDAGQSIENVAARFGVTPLVVQRRLKLANVHPSLIARFRDGEITLECLMAFAITDDHARQLEVWEGQKRYERSPDAQRAALTEHEVSVDKPIGRFVGLKAYEKAGGVVRRDLFAEENEGVLLDAALVRKLATEKLEKCAQKLRKEGIPWIHVRPELDYAERAAYRGVNTVYRDPTEEERKALDDIAAELNRIESEMAELRDDDERAAALERQAEELDKREEALNVNLSMPDPQQQALAGALVSIGADGKVRIERDVLKPEDASRLQQRLQQGRKMRLRNSGEKGPRVHSAVLVRSLTAQRTLALQATLTQRPDVALAALTHRLLLEAFSPHGSGRASALRINAKNADLAPYAEELAGSRAEVTLRARCEAVQAQLPKDPERLLGWLLKQPQTDVLALLSFCVAVTVDGVESDERPSAWDELAHAAGCDMRTWWSATAKNYLAHVSKARILEVVREALSPEVAATMATLKKAPLTDTAERRLAGTGWLPTLLRHGG